MRVLISILLALLCISCSEESMVDVTTNRLDSIVADGCENESELIELKIYSQLANSTRLSGCDWDLADQIGVYMIYSNSYTNLADNVQYETLAGDGIFTSYDEDEKIFYPHNQSPVDLFAYYPYSDETTKLGVIEIDLSSKYQQDQEQIDLLSSYVGDIKMEDRDNPVIFNFEHQLSRVDFVIYPGDGYRVADLDNMSVEISKQQTKASYSAHTKELSDYQSDSVGGDDIVFYSTTDSDCVLASAIILPQTTSSDCEVTFSLANGEVFEWDLPVMSIESGQNMIYRINIHQRGIERVSANIGSWGELEEHAGEEYDYIAIWNEADLIKFRDDVNAGVSKSAMLMQDITLTSEWQPIGSELYPFIATFNGGDKCISGLQISDGNKSYQGLFGVVGDGVNECCIANVKVENPTIDSGASCGVIAGLSNGVTFMNCHVAGGEISGADYVGGVVGTAISTMIRSCSVESVAMNGATANEYAGEMRDGTIVIE